MTRRHGRQKVVTGAVWLKRLLVGVPLRRREVSPQFFRRATRTVAGRIGLDAPPFPQRSSVDRVEAELVEQARHGRLGARIVAGDDKRPAVLRAGRLSVGGDLPGSDMVERLDDF